MLRKLSQIPEYYREHTGAVWSAPGLTIFSRFPVGANILAKADEWDIAVVLDTCRPDALREVQSEFSFLQNVSIQRRWSVGSASPEWVGQTFTREYIEEISKLGYITANPFTKRILSEGQSPDESISAGFAPCSWDIVLDSEFAFVDYVMDKADPLLPQFDQYGLASAEAVTDFAIARWRREDARKLVLHYMQPHNPYFHSAISDGRDYLHEYEEEPFPYLRNGGNQEKVWDAYLEDLRGGLKSVERLLRNTDARIMITSDHGDAFGEFGVYGHRCGSIHPQMRWVPWAIVNGQNTENQQIDIDFERKNDRDIDSQLDALGYK